MKKALILLLTLVCLVASSLSTAFAVSFSMLASTGVLQLGNNQAWKQEYKTDIGKFKISFRKMWNKSDQKKYHLFIEWNKKRIADGYCPSNSTGYSFKIFQNQETSRIYVALETTGRTVLMGYDPVADRLEKYADSKDYHSQIGRPRFLVDTDKDLSLAFVGNGHENPTVYKLFWDPKNNWFGYKDVTIHPEAPEPNTPDYEPEYEPQYEPQYEPPQYEEQVAGPITEKPAASGELFYPEEEIVVGS